MRKIIGLLIMVTTLLVGCSGGKIADTEIKEDNTITESKIEDKEEVKEEVLEESKEDPAQVSEKVDGTDVKIIEYKITTPIGDRTADNYASENGEYFAIGSEIVKCSDYNNIHVVAELTNNREILYKSSAMAWGAEMEDGYKLEIFQNGVGVGMMNEGTLGKQIQSGNTITVEFDILKEKSVKGDLIILKYWDVDFGDEFGKFMSAVMGGASEEQCKKDYPQYFDESKTYEFELLVQ